MKARPPLLASLRRELFASRADAVISVGLLAAIGAALVGLLRWAFGQAEWVVIQANSTLFALGRYPLSQQWRLWLLMTLLAMATGLSWGLLRANPRADRSGVLWPANDRIAVAVLAFLTAWAPAALLLALPLQLRWWAITALLLVLRWAAGRWGRQLPAQLLRWVPLIWPLLYLLGMVLISGGLGLIQVPPSEWGGLLLTVLMASFAILASFPLGVLMALGRRSELPLLRWGSIGYIEFIRGAPLITLLFLGQNILGFLLPVDWRRIGSGGRPGCSPSSVAPMWPRRCGPGWPPCPGASRRLPARSASACPRPCSTWCCPRPCASPCPPPWGSSSPCCRTPPCSP